MWAPTRFSAFSHIHFGNKDVKEARSLRQGEQNEQANGIAALIYWVKFMATCGRPRTRGNESTDHTRGLNLATFSCSGQLGTWGPTGGSNPQEGMEASRICLGQASLKI